MEEKELISIIIPCYNSEKFIRKTIVSIKNQTYLNFEVIFVDDGSKDNTVKVINENLEGSNINYTIIKQKNSGVSSARNKGILNCKGKYIFFLDSDDFIENTFVEKMANKAIKENLDIVWCGYDYIGDDGNILHKYVTKYKFQENNSLGVEVLQNHLKYIISLCNINIMYKRELIISNNISFIEKCYYGEDQEFIIKALFNAKKVGCVKEVLVYYYQRTNSATHTFSLSRFSGLGAMKRLEKYFNSKNASNDILNLINNRLAFEIIHIYHNFLTSETIDSSGYNIDNIFYNVRRKYYKHLKQFKINSKNDFKYKILIMLFCIHPKIYRFALKKFR